MLNFSSDGYMSLRTILCYININKGAFWISVYVLQSVHAWRLRHSCIVIFWFVFLLHTGCTFHSTLFAHTCITQKNREATFACFSSSTWTRWCPKCVTARFACSFHNRRRTYKERVCAPARVCAWLFWSGRLKTSQRSEYCYLIGAIIPSHTQTHTTFTPLPSTTPTLQTSSRAVGGACECAWGGWGLWGGGEWST